MGDLATEKATDTRAPIDEAILRDALTRGDRALRGVAPVLSHMLANADQTLVNEEIVARLHGMFSDLARQLTVSEQGELSNPDPANIAAQDMLAERLAEDSALLSHCYALAMEGHLTTRLQHRNAIDPVLSPLLQELIASDQPIVAELAMRAMAAQARFAQSQRRMRMPLHELPAELFLGILKHLERTAHETDRQNVTDLKRGYDESATRISLLAKLVSAMQGGSPAALDLKHAGLALFSSALSAMIKQPRELAILSCHHGQTVRFALSLRAAGQEWTAIERQFQILEPAQLLPRGMAHIASDRAAAMLRHSSLRTAG